MAKKKRSVAVRFPIIPTKLDLTDKRQGFLALLIGLLLAVIGSLALPSLVSAGAVVSTVLALGLIVGILNIFHKDALTFLILALSATFMLSVLTSADVFPVAVKQLFSSVAYMLAAASTIVSLKVVYALTQ